MNNSQAEKKAGLYQQRKTLLEDAFRLSGTESNPALAVALPQLVNLIKQRAARCPGLTSLYFAGAETDHPFFLQNSRVAVGISVLPEDAPKAGRTKRHPHQQEVIIVLEGEILLRLQQGAVAENRKLLAGEMWVIGKDQGHCIRPVAGQQAVYMFIKTNPTLEPRGIDCRLPS